LRGAGRATHSQKAERMEQSVATGRHFIVMQGRVAHTPVRRGRRRIVDGERSSLRSGARSAEGVVSEVKSGAAKYTR